MGYAVFHATKGSGAGGKLGAHIDRDQSQAQTFKSADPERKHLNVDLLNDGFSMMKLSKAIDEKIKQGYKGKKAIRKDAVKFLPMVMTGSHKEMKEIFADKIKADEWVRANYHFACKEFGAENIVRATLHLDEKTPHLHIVAVPLTKDGRLSAKEVFGDIKALSERQDRYAEAMKPFGLERGVKGSKSVHTSEGWYIGKQKEAEKTFLDPLESLSLLERVNPYKKIEVLSEGLKLAVRHKFDSDNKAEREQRKVSELVQKNKNLENRLHNIIGNSKEWQAEQENRVKKLQQDISYEVRRKLDYSFNLHQMEKPKLEEHVSNLILAEGRKQTGMTQELFDKVYSTNDFAKKILEKAEARAEQNLGRDQGKNRGFRL